MHNKIRYMVVTVAALGLVAAACTSAAPTTESPAAVTVTTSTPAAVTTTAPSTSSMAPSTTTPQTTEPSANTGRVFGAGSTFIPLDDPVMVAASSATWLDPDDVVLGIVTPDGTAQAFPIRQMAYHHIANTTIDGEPYLVTY